MLRARTTDVVFMGLAFAVLYFLLRSAGQTPDGLSYAVAAREGVDLYHPHHLLYGPVTRFIYLLTGSRDAIQAGVLHNLMWLVVLAFGAWRLAGQLRWTHGAALLAATALLASRGVLYYATHVETYLPALACLVMFTAVWFKPQRSDLEAMAWLALAVLYHQSNVLLVVPLLVTSDRPRQDFLRVVLPAGVVVLGLYLAAWRLSAVEVEFVPWLLTYVQADVPAWGSMGHFSEQGVLKASLSQMRMVLPVPVDFSYYGSGAMLGVLGFLVFWHLRQKTYLRERRFALIYLAVYLLFFLWWIPSDADFFLATLWPLWWLGLLLLIDLGPRWQGWWLAAPVAVLLVGNLWFTAVPLHRYAGEDHLRAMELHQATEPATALVVSYGVEQELLYYTTREAVYEGDALGLRWQVEGSGCFSAVVIEPVYLDLLLARFWAQDEALLRSLLDYTSEGATRRTYMWLPGGRYLKIVDEYQPAESWTELLGKLALGPPELIL